MPPVRRKSPHRRSNRRSRSRSHSTERRRRKLSDSRRRRSRSTSHHRRSPRRRSPRPHSPHRPSRGSFSPRRKSPPHRRSVSPRRKSPVGRKHSFSPQRRHTGSHRNEESSRQSSYIRDRSSSPSHMVTSSQGGKEYRDHSPHSKREHSLPRNKQFSPDTSLTYRGGSQDVFSPVPLPDSASSLYMDPLSTIPPYQGQSSSPPYSDRDRSINSLTILNTNIFRQLLTDRFRTDEEILRGPFDFEDNITIGIHRAPHLRNLSPVPVDHDIDLNKFIFPRRNNEGISRLFDREEIKIFRHDENLNEDPDYYEEKRTISIVPSKRQSTNYDDEDTRIPQDIGFLQGFSSNKIRLNINDLDDYDSRDRRRVQGHNRRDSEGDRRRHKEPLVRLDPKPDPRYEALLKTETDENNARDIPRNPNDLRHSLLKRRHDEGGGFDARKRIEARRKTDDRGKLASERDRSRSGHRGIDRSTSGQHGRERSPQSGVKGRDDRQRGKPKSEKSELPDFSRRQDKYKYEEWKDKPELIPRNPSYFEHDNREGDDSSGFFRGRGRGRGIRGRPFRGSIGRGSFRIRGRRSPPRDFRDFRRGSRRDTGGGDWKHDLFDKLEKEDDEKPSSTTKN